MKESMDIRILPILATTLLIACTGGAEEDRDGEAQNDGGATCSCSDSGLRVEVNFAPGDACGQSDVGATVTFMTGAKLVKNDIECMFPEYRYDQKEQVFLYSWPAGVVDGESANIDYSSTGEGGDFASGSAAFVVDTSGCQTVQVDAACSSTFPDIPDIQS